MPSESSPEKYVRAQKKRSKSKKKGRKSGIKQKKNPVPIERFTVQSKKVCKGKVTVAQQDGIYLKGLRSHFTARQPLNEENEARRDEDLGRLIDYGNSLNKTRRKRGSENILQTLCLDTSRRRGNRRSAPPDRTDAVNPPPPSTRGDPPPPLSRGDHPPPFDLFVHPGVPPPPPPSRTSRDVSQRRSTGGAGGSSRSESRGDHRERRRSSRTEEASSRVSQNLSHQDRSTRYQSVAETSVHPERKDWSTANTSESIPLFTSGGTTSAVCQVSVKEKIPPPGFNWFRFHPQSHSTPMPKSSSSPMISSPGQKFETEERVLQYQRRLDSCFGSISQKLDNVLDDRKLLCDYYMKKLRLIDVASPEPERQRRGIPKTHKATGDHRVSPPMNGLQFILSGGQASSRSLQPSPPPQEAVHLPREPIREGPPLPHFEEMFLEPFPLMSYLEEVQFSGAVDLKPVDPKVESNLRRSLQKSELLATPVYTYHRRRMF